MKTRLENAANQHLGAVTGMAELSATRDTGKVKNPVN